MNAYELLECKHNATTDEIKQSYHRLLLHCHPDKIGTDACRSTSIDLFMKIQSAYKLLSDSEARASYDSILKQIELKEKATELSETDILTLDNDFDLNAENNAYTKRCRCGDIFSIEKDYLSKFFSQAFNSPLKNDSFILSLECGTCSLLANVLIL